MKQFCFKILQCSPYQLYCYIGLPSTLTVTVISASVHQKTHGICLDQLCIVKKLQFRDLISPF